MFLLQVQLKQKQQHCCQGQALCLVSVAFTLNKKKEWLYTKTRPIESQCLLIMYNHGSVTVGRLLFDDADQFKGFANRTIRIWPFWTLKMPHFEYIVILQERKKTQISLGKDCFLIFASIPIWLQPPPTTMKVGLPYLVSSNYLQSLFPPRVFQSHGILALS